MGREDVFLEGRELGREAFETETKLFGALGPALPPVVRHDGPVDLNAYGETPSNGVRGQALGVGAEGYGGPSDPHEGRVSSVHSWAQAGNSPLTGHRAGCVLTGFQHRHPPAMRDDYIKDALKTIPDPNILINVISRRVKQLKRGNRPLVESLEKLTPEDTALREVIEGKISHELA